LEKEIGIPEVIVNFKKRLEESDAIVLSLAEHNGMITAAFKNIWDWTSRIDPKIWMNKPLFLAATSPGGRGAKSVLETTKKLIPHYGGNVIVDFSLPLFFQNFKKEKVVEEEISKELEQKILHFSKSI
jgi:NAD(P)H-dependent FMN reductase